MDKSRTKLRKNIKNKFKVNRLLILLLFASIILVSINYVSAYKRLCLTYGEVIPSAENPRYICWHDSCQVCVTDENYPARPSRCNGIIGCSEAEDVEPNLEPPELTVNSPLDGEIFNSRRVLFDITSNEPVTLSYSSDNGQSWRRMVGNSKSYKRDLNFYEGENKVRIKGANRNGNEAEVERVFYVDSKPPRITSTTPRGGFIGSVFTVEYNENNVKEIKLHYGVEGDYQEKILDGCISGNRESCSVDVNLSFYDRQEIEYWFSLEDIAGNIVESKKVKVFVDESEPEIINVGHEVRERNVYFNIEINEAFLQEVGYSYTDDRGRENKRRLCSRLINNICDGRGSFKDGEWNIMIYVLDKAGNKDEFPLSFFIDSKSPRIKRTSPLDGLTNGDFSVEFDEENPVSLNLYYGVGEEFRNTDVDLNLCSKDKGSYSCNIHVDLKEFNGEEIKYWFEIEDRLGQKDKSRAVEIGVDTDFPILLNEDFWTQGGGRYNKYVYFNLEIEENNFEEVSYSYVDYRGRTIERKICNKLREGKCETKAGFKTGHYNLYIQITDKAGNSIGKGIEFDVV